MTTEEQYSELAHGLANALGHKGKPSEPEPDPTPSGPPIAPSEGTPRYTTTADPMAEFLNNIFGN